MNLQNKRTIEGLHWALNTNTKTRKPFWEIGLYSDSQNQYIIKQTRSGLIFNDTLEILNQLGFNLYAINTDENLIMLIVQDRNNREIVESAF